MQNDDSVASRVVWGNICPNKVSLMKPDLLELTNCSFKGPIWKSNLAPDKPQQLCVHCSLRLLFSVKSISRDGSLFDGNARLTRKPKCLLGSLYSIFIESVHSLPRHLEHFQIWASSLGQTSK